MLLHRNQAIKRRRWPLPSNLSHIVAIETNVGEKKAGGVFQGRVDLSCVSLRKFDGVSG